MPREHIHGLQRNQKIGDIVINAGREMVVQVENTHPVVAMMNILRTVISMLISKWLADGVAELLERADHGLDAPRHRFGKTMLPKTRELAGYFFTIDRPEGRPGSLVCQTMIQRQPLTT